MSNIDSPAGSHGAYGTATVRARKHQDSNEAAAFSPQARDARIAQLRKQYLEGTYQVDADKLSAVLIRRHLAEDA
jgi:anti-sigma28 factor (negative regulator of flagellin synthesis)